MARTIQFKRNRSIASNANEAKQKINEIASGLTNGEIVLGIYSDPKAVNGIADVIAIKANDKIFYDDNQTILNKIGINHDGTEDADAAADSIVKQLAGLGDVVEAVSGDIETVSDAVDAVSGEVEDIKEFIGMTTGDTGQSITAKISEISGKVDTVSSEVTTLASNIGALCGKTVTDVEDTTTIDFTKEDAADGTKKIKADVKISEAAGNILSATSSGLYTQVDYNSTTNSLIINGVEKQLAGGSVIDSITYDSETESLVITYHDTSGVEHTVSAPLGDLINEYEFDDTTDADHNTKFTVTRDVSGGTFIQADVQNFDCGEY